MQIPDGKGSGFQTERDAGSRGPGSRVQRQGMQVPEENRCRFQRGGKHIREGSDAGSGWKEMQIPEWKEVDSIGIGMQIPKRSEPDSRGNGCR